MIVSLREINADTVRQVTNLSVGAEQQRFVASNAVSLAQALFSREAWYRAIYLDDSPAGFVMLYDESLRSDPPPSPEAAVWRFMVDAQFQRRGVGTAALDQVIAHVRSKRRFATLSVSYVPGPGCPEAFYLRAGFKHTGKIEDGEVVLELPLLPDAAGSPKSTTRKGGSPMVQPFDPAAFAQRQLDAYNARDLERFVREYTDDVMVWRMPDPKPAIAGRAALAAYYRDNRFNLPGLHAELVNRMVFGNKVIDQEIVHGVPGAPLHGAAIYEVTEQGICKMWFFSAR